MTLIRFLLVILKAAGFAALILIASHLISWNGQTVNDQIRSTLSAAERAIPLKVVRKKSEEMIESVRKTRTEQIEKIQAAEKEELQSLMEREPDQG